MKANPTKVESKKQTEESEKVEEVEVVLLDPSEFNVGFMLAQETIDLVMECMMKALYDKEIARKAIPYGITSVECLILSVIESFYLRIDSEIEWEFDELEEPVPTLIDSWARSVIPVHKKFKRQESTVTSVLNDTKSNTFRTTFNKTKLFKKNLKPTPQIYDEEVKIEPIDYKERSFDEHEEFMRLKKERDNKVKLIEKERLKQVKLEEKKKRNMIMLKFGGKVPNYTHDSKGGLIVITPLKILKNSDYEQVGYKIKEPEVQEVEQKNLPPIIETFSPYVTRHPTQSSHMKLEPLEQTKKVKGAIDLDKLRLAPGVFLEKLLSPEEAEHALLTKSLKKVQSERKIANSQSQSIKKESVTLKPIQNSKLLESLPETSPDPQGHTFSNSQSLSTLPIKKPSKDVVKVYKQLSGNEELTPVDIFNLKLLTNKEWGLNPPYSIPKVLAKVPKTLTTRENWEIYGHIMKKNLNNPFASSKDLLIIPEEFKKPRDRPFIEKKKHKSKQPPPPFGLTMSLPAKKL
ncbi:hypothetical protein SteCoe_25910 [Stentor coeruleus]|uniref:Uncharacterized protein n=1 Tax=Stentor coeruleus TaxID=5963 RepID=A0A1R2BE35_9CILI|nr:hypothetical protein SteCoe_25910 [Stentor coeruleus]